MFVAMSARLRADRERFRLHFTCDECANFCEERQACAILYPVEPHTKAHVDALADGERVWFCKMWEAR